MSKKKKNQVKYVPRYLTCVTNLFRMRSGDVGNTSEAWSKIIWKEQTFYLERFKEDQAPDYWFFFFFFFESPPSDSSDVSSFCLRLSSECGAFTVQNCPFFFRAGVTTQSRIGTSMIRSHRNGSAEHRRPSSRSTTCVTLWKTDSQITAQWSLSWDWDLFFFFFTCEMIKTNSENTSKAKHDWILDIVSSKYFIYKWKSCN